MGSDSSLSLADNVQEFLSLIGTECTFLSQCSSESNLWCHQCCQWVFWSIAKLPYPVVAEIFLSAKLMFAWLCLVSHSNQTSCLWTIWKNPLMFTLVPCHMLFLWRGLKLSWCKWKSNQALRIELISDHLPDLPLCHMIDVCLYTLFAWLTRLTSLPHVRCRLVQPVCIWTGSFLVSFDGLQACMIRMTCFISLINYVIVNLWPLTRLTILLCVCWLL